MRKKSITKKNSAPTVSYTAPWRLSKVTPLEHYKLDVEFIDGTRGIVEMEQLISSPKAGVFAKLKNAEIFNQVHLEHGAATWPGEIDLAPDAMYEAIKKDGLWTLR